METTANSDSRGVTPEDVWAVLRDLAERQKETDRQMKERQKEYAEQLKESEQQWNRRMGNLSNRFGEIAEHLVAPGINKRFNQLGYHFGEVFPGGVKVEEDGKIKTQIDLLLENDDTIMAVEVKSKPDEDDIADHIRRLEILRDYRRKKNDLRQVEGAIAGAIFKEAVKKATTKAGLYVIEQSGDTMKIEVPHGFVPRKW